jgi:glycine/D-amino acid oxidase-like deaminating enzyme
MLSCRAGTFTGEAGIFMRSVVVGSGPTGLSTAVALARRGHQVTVIDRDPGPDGGQWWDRKGVMQFHHPHHFREQVADALLAEMPEVWRGLLAAGAVPAVHLCRNEHVFVRISMRVPEDSLKLFSAITAQSSSPL